MGSLLRELRHSPILWLLVFAPLAIAGESLWPEKHTLLFVFSVLAIIPLAALLSHATESVAAQDRRRGRRPAQRDARQPDRTVIALTALRAGEYMLVKASIAGAIVTNSCSCSAARF